MKKLIGFVACLAFIACKHDKIAVIPKQTSDFKKADSLWSQGKADSAFYYFDKAASVSKDSLERATAYNYMAYIQSDAGDYYGAQESLANSLEYLNDKKQEHLSCLASDYNELGMTSSKLQNYDSAIGYFDLALKYSDDENYRNIFLNNKANAHREQKSYNKALVLYQQVYKNTDHSGKEFARLLTNMSSTQWRRDSAYNAAPQLLKALYIREQSKDVWGQNSSYRHLAEYYSRSQPDSGLFYAKRMQVIAIKLRSPDDELQALKLLIKLSPNAIAKRYFSRYEQLNDSLQTARNAAKNQFALIRYHTEKSKADNLLLQKENSDKQYRLIQQKIWIYGLIILFAVAIFLTYYWYQKKKQLVEKEKQEAIMESQRKASKIVHDTLANDLYRIMKTIQYGSESEPGWLVDNLDDVYKRARDLSYDIVVDVEDYELKISVLLKTFASNFTRVVIVGNSRELWQKISAPVKVEIRYILQELMINMKKHSQATNVVVRFEQHGNQCKIIYVDDGIGISEEAKRNNGLTNTENRINTIGGQITFDTAVNKGLQIDITFSI